MSPPCRCLLAAPVLMALLLTPLIAVRANAQSGTSVIAGIVKDTSGGVIPGANVRVIYIDTGVAIETFANVDAMYRVPALTPGRYRVVVTADGFETRSVGGVVLEVNNTVAVDVTLDIARQSESVQVLAVMCRWSNRRPRRSRRP